MVDLIIKDIYGFRDDWEKQLREVKIMKQHDWALKIEGKLELLDDMIEELENGNSRFERRE